MGETTSVPYEEELSNTGEGGARQFVFPDIDAPVWIPNSIIEKHDEDAKEVTLPVWFAIERDLI
ncbi:MAG: hypothetical protein DRJ03_01875 [Chloroflexi bacterium]|nr:MAG: hypothetical protein DRJ03_01875 [Chloroflexota bacterium]